MSKSPEKTATVIVMCSNIYDPDCEKRLKGARFECDKEWAESIREGDVMAEREYRLEII